MSKPFSLQAVLDLMQTRADEATRQLASLIAAEHDAKSKLAMLQNYRDEYGARFRQAVQDGLDQPQWHNFQGFLRRLDEAISQQLDAVRRQETHTAGGQAAWQQQRIRLKAFDALSERHRANQTKLDLREEQKAQDEFATRRSGIDPDG